MKQILNPDVYLIENFLPAEEADTLLHFLLPEQGNVNWEQHHLTFADKVVPFPRLTAWFGSKSYYYSGVKNVPASFKPEMLPLKELLEKTVEHPFNSVLLNYYKNGNNHINWHADKESELGEKPIIASYSLGQERVFQLKPRNVEGRRKASDTQSILLKHNSLLVMMENTQKNWLHCVLKDETLTQPRINMTFRRVI